MAEQVQRTGPVGAPQPHARDRLNSSRSTHFVQCTPGSAGTTIRAGKPWSADRSAPLTRSASSERRSAAWPAAQRRAAEAAALLQGLHEHLVESPRRRRAQRGRAAARRSTSASSTSPRRRRSAARRSAAAAPAAARARARPGAGHRSTCRRQSAPVCAACDADRPGRLVDLEVVGPGAEIASVRGEQRDLAQRAADGLADGQRQQPQRCATGQAEDAAARDRRRARRRGDELGLARSPAASRRGRDAARPAAGARAGCARIVGTLSTACSTNAAMKTQPP